MEVQKFLAAAFGFDVDVVGGRTVYSVGLTQLGMDGGGITV